MCADKGRSPVETFHLSLLPFVDLSEMERQVCEQTAHFEDFVMLFLDKVLVLIDNCNGTEATRADAATWGKDLRFASVEIDLRS